METNANSPDLPSDTINIIVEFAQPEANEVKKNGKASIGGKDVAVHVVQISSALLNPTSSQTSLTSGAEVASIGPQEASCRDVIERIKKRLNGRMTAKPSKSNSRPPSASNPSISYPSRPLLTSVQQPSVGLRIQNGQLLHHQTQTEKEKPEITPSESPVQKPTNDMGGCQITNSTKLALKNFLKKKSTCVVNGIHVSGERNRNRTGAEVQVISPVGEAGGSLCKDEKCSNKVSGKEKNPAEVLLIGTEVDKVPMTAVSEFSTSSNPVQSSQNSDVSPNELSSTVVQGADSNLPSTPQSDGKQINGGSSAAMSQETSARVVQEVDVVVLPSLLEPDKPKQKTKCIRKRKQATTDAKKTETKRYVSRDCVECGKTLPSKRVYLAHMNIHYDIRPHKCDECEKSFRQRGHLDKHKLLHTGEKPYVCQHCGKGFRCRYLQRDHERIHTGEKPCKCNVCGKMLRCLTSLSTHQRGVHKIGPSTRRYGAKCTTVFTCKICKKTFTWSSALSAHKKTHNIVGSYKCNKCPKVFKCNSNLWNHKKSHSKEKPFECDLCGQRLKRRGNLKRHLLTQHDLEEAEECLKTSKQFGGSYAKKVT